MNLKRFEIGNFRFEIESKAKAFTAETRPQSGGQARRTLRKADRPLTEGPERWNVEGKSIRQNKTGGERPGGDSTSRGGWGYYRKPAGCESSYSSSNPAHRRGHIYMGYHT